MSAENQQYSFTTNELEKLAAYRAAINAGFYNDYQNVKNSRAFIEPTPINFISLPGVKDETSGQFVYPVVPIEQYTSLKRIKEAVFAGQYEEDCHS